MTVVETLLVFVAAPLGVCLVLALLILIPGGRKRRRYKPGQAWDYPPVWYEPHPEHGPAGGDHSGSHGDGRPEAQAIGSSLFPEHQAIEGGSHGAPAARPPQPVPAGPLGGARGTW